MLKIEFLYYDKTVCKRCISTDKSVKSTLKELKNIIKNANVKINLKEKKLPKSKTYLSPSILINGKDIERIVNKNSKLKYNVCRDCCKLISSPVSCRTFNYRNKNYNHIPKKMITEAIKIVLKHSN